MAAQDTEGKLIDLPLSKVEIDGGTQMRGRIDERTVAEYAEALEEGVTLPAAVVFHDGRRYWLADGFHRFHGSRKAGLGTLFCEVRKGTRRDAILHAAGANASHGLRRTNADKRRAVETLLRDEEWSKASESWIASACRVSRDLVTRVRGDLQIGKSPERTGRDGRTINTGNIGRRTAEPPVADHAPATDGTPDDDDPELTSAEPQWAETDEDREPVLTDEDWDQAEREEAERKAAAPSFDDASVTKQLGKAARLIDERASALGQQGTEGHGRCLAAVNAALVAYREWAGDAS